MVIHSRRTYGHSVIRGDIRCGPCCTTREPSGRNNEGAWQRAHSLGDWTHVGCTVAPPFSFDAFDLIEDRQPEPS